MIPKRVFWFAAGVASGAAALLRTQREIPNPSDRDDPQALLKAARGLVQESRERMQDRLEGRT